MHCIFSLLHIPPPLLGTHPPPQALSCIVEMGRGRPPPRDNRKELARKKKRQFYKNAKLIQKYRSVREKERANHIATAGPRNGVNSALESSSSGASRQSQQVDFYEATFGDVSSDRYRFSGSGRTSNAWNDDREDYTSGLGAQDANIDRGERQSIEKFKPLTRKATSQRTSRPNPFKKQLSKREEQKRLNLQKLEEAAQKKIKLAQSLKHRKRKAKKMNRRSRHGQPVMENHIDQILAKLQDGK